MTILRPWKWKPRSILYRDRYCGWQWFFYQHTDHNPVIIVMRWNGKWYMECYGLKWPRRTYG